MMNSKPADRRSFLQSTSVAALATGGYSATARGYAKNEMISLGLIGAGNRGRNVLLQAVKKLPGVQVNGVCDVYDDHRNSAHVMAGGREREVFQTVDHRALLARNDIDAVIIATPDHWHVPICIEACDAGKDAYVEKPLIHKIEEGRQVIDAVRRTKSVVQVGAQQRSMPHFIELRRRLQSGELDIGPIHRIHMQWNSNHTPYYRPEYKIRPEQVDWQRFLGNAPPQPFDPLRMFKWRFMWDFGNGLLGDFMIHWLDAVNWLLDLPMPSCIASLGGHYTTQGDWEAPDTIKTVYEYPGLDMLADFESTYANDHDRAGIRIMGERATVYIDRQHFEITPQRKSQSNAETVLAGDGTNSSSRRDETVLHLADWLEAVRERRDPSDSVESAVQACNVCIYGNDSYRKKRRVEIA
jgi:predicted dehydrogenase